MSSGPTTPRDKPTSMILGAVLLPLSRFAVGQAATSYYELVRPDHSPIEAPVCRLRIHLPAIPLDLSGSADPQTTEQSKRVHDGLLSLGPKLSKASTRPPSSGSASNSDAVYQQPQSAFDSSPGSQPQPEVPQHSQRGIALSDRGRETIAQAIDRLGRHTIKSMGGNRAQAQAQALTDDDDDDEGELKSEGGPLECPGIPVADACVIICWQQMTNRPKLLNPDIVVNGVLTAQSKDHSPDVDEDRPLYPPTSFALPPRLVEAIGPRWRTAGAHAGYSLRSTAAPKQPQSHILWRWPSEDSDQFSVPPQLAPFVAESAESAERHSKMRASASTSASAATAGEDSASLFDSAIALVTRLPDPHSRVYAALSDSIRLSVPLIRASAEAGSVSNLGGVASEASSDSEELSVAVVLLTRSASCIAYLKEQANRMAQAWASSHMYPEVAADPFGALRVTTDQLRACSAPATLSPALRVKQGRDRGHGCVCIGRSAADWQQVMSPRRRADRPLGIGSIQPRSLTLGAQSPTYELLAPLIGSRSNLGAAACMQVILGLLAERRTIVVGKSAGAVQSAVVAFLDLIQPLHWELPVLPLVPGYLLSRFIAAPVPFLYGCTREGIELALLQMCKEGSKLKSGRIRQVSKVPQPSSLLGQCQGYPWYRQKHQHGVMIVDIDTGCISQGKLYPSLVAAACLVKTASEPRIAPICILPHVMEGILAGVQRIPESLGNDAAFPTAVAAAAASWCLIARVFAPLLLGAGGLVSHRPRPNSAWFSSIHLALARKYRSLHGQRTGDGSLSSRPPVWMPARFFRRVATSQAAQMVAERLAAWEKAASLFQPFQQSRAFQQLRGVLQLPIRFREVLLRASVDCRSISEVTSTIASTSTPVVASAQELGNEVVDWARTSLVRVAATRYCVAVASLDSTTDEVRFQLRPLALNRLGSFEQLDDESTASPASQLGLISVDRAAGVQVIFPHGERATAGGIAVFGAALVGGLPCIAPLLTVRAAAAAGTRSPGGEIPCMHELFDSSRAGMLGPAFFTIEPQLRFGWQACNDTTCEPGVGEHTGALEHHLFGRQGLSAGFTQARHSVSKAPTRAIGLRSEAEQIATFAGCAEPGHDVWNHIPASLVQDVVDALTRPAEGDMRSSEHDGSWLDSPEALGDSRHSSGQNSPSSEVQLQHGRKRAIRGHVGEGSSISPNSRIQPESHDLARPIPSTSWEADERFVSKGSIGFAAQPRSRSRHCTPEIDMEHFMFDKREGESLGQCLDGAESSDSEGVSGLKDGSLEEDAGHQATAEDLISNEREVPISEQMLDVHSCMDDDRRAVFGEVMLLAAGSPLDCLLLVLAAVRFLRMRSLCMPGGSKGDATVVGPIALPDEVLHEVRTAIQATLKLVEASALGTEPTWQLYSYCTGSRSSAAKLFGAANAELVSLNLPRSHVLDLVVSSFQGSAQSIDLVGHIDDGPGPGAPTASTQLYLSRPVEAMCLDHCIAKAMTVISFKGNEHLLLSAIGTDAILRIFASRLSTDEWVMAAEVPLRDVAVLCQRHEAPAASTRRRRSSAGAFDFPPDVAKHSKQVSYGVDGAALSRGASLRRIGSSLHKRSASSTFLSKPASFRLRLDTALAEDSDLGIASKSSQVRPGHTHVAVGLKRSFRGQQMSISFVNGSGPGCTLAVVVGLNGECLVLRIQPRDAITHSDGSACDTQDSRLAWGIVPVRWLLSPMAFSRTHSRSSRKRQEDECDMVFPTVSIGWTTSRPQPSDEVSDTESRMQSQLCLEVVVGQSTLSRQAVKSDSPAQDRPSIGTHTDIPQARAIAPPCRYVLTYNDIVASPTSTSESTPRGERVSPARIVPELACQLLKPHEEYGPASSEMDAVGIPLLLTHSTECKLLVTTGTPNRRVARVTIVGDVSQGHVSLTHAGDLTCGHAILAGMADPAQASGRISLVATAQADGVVSVWQLQGPLPSQVSPATSDEESVELYQKLVLKSRCFMQVSAVLLWRLAEQETGSSSTIAVLAACNDGIVRVWDIVQSDSLTRDIPLLGLDTSGASALPDESTAIPAPDIPSTDKPSCLLGMPGISVGVLPRESAPSVGMAEFDGAPVIVLSWLDGAMAVWRVRSGPARGSAATLLAFRESSGHGSRQSSKRGSFAAIAETAVAAQGRPRGMSGFSTTSVDADVSAASGYPTAIVCGFPRAAAAGELLASSHGEKVLLLSRKSGT